MAKQTINIGASPNDGTGTPLRTAFDYTNQNFTELYTATGPSGNNIVVPGNATITGDLTVRTNKLAVTSTGVGINGTSAAYPLEINGGASASTSQFKSTGSSVITRFTDGTGETGYIGSGTSLITGIGRTDFGIASNGALVFGVSTGLAMTLNSTGLGVGVSPSYKLDVNGTARIGTVGTAGRAALIYSASASNLTIEQTNNGSGSHVFDIKLPGWTTDVFTVSSGSTTRFTLTGDGNVGVGVTPSAWAAGFKVIQASTGVAISTNAVVDRCDISANYYFNAGNKFLNATGRASSFSQDGGAFYFYQSTGTSGGVGSAITWGPGMTLDASGNLLVGTTSGTSFRIISSFLSSSGNGGIKLIDSQSNNTAVFANFSNGTGTLGSITNNNNAGVSYNINSDYRLKESVQPLTGGLARVKALKPSIYKWKSNGSDGEGFLAHELAEVVPSAVTGEKDAVNQDGTIKAQGVDLSKVVPILVAAIQELTARVEALEA